MTVLYADLEEKNAPVFAPGAGLTLNGPASGQQQGQAGVVGTPAGAGGMQGQGAQGQVQGGMGGLGGVGGMVGMGQRGPFQGVGMAAM